MAESTFDETQGSAVSKRGGSKKMYALVFVVIILVGVIGLMLFSGFGGMFPFTESVNSPEQAANTLSDLGNDISGISDELKDMENIL